MTEKGTPLKDDILHAPYPKGTAGAATLHPPQTRMLMGYSKNQKAAKDFLRWLSSRSVFEKWFVSQKGFSIPAARAWSTHPLWNEDPVSLSLLGMCSVAMVQCVPLLRFRAPDGLSIANTGHVPPLSIRPSGR